MISSNAESLVIDAGVGYVLCVEDPASATLRANISASLRNGIRLFAPGMWRYELTSIFTKAVYFQQLSEPLARQGLQLASKLHIDLIQPDHELVMDAFDWTRRLRCAAAYDSFYLALARRLGCPLWTTDRHLANAVAEAWVRYVGNVQPGTSP